MGWPSCAAEAPDVVILDLMLPGLDGVEVCRQIRTFSDAYVLMLTARSEEIDRVVGLSVGADDYVVKPFSPREVVARIKALLRRPRATGRALAPDGLVVDEQRHDVLVDGRPIELTAIEFGIVAALARNPGIVLTRAALLDGVWGPEFVGDDHLVDVHVANLRRKLGDDPGRTRFVETVRCGRLSAGAAMMPGAGDAAGPCSPSGGRLPAIPARAAAAGQSRHRRRDARHCHRRREPRRTGLLRRGDGPPAG